MRFEKRFRVRTLKRCDFCGDDLSEGLMGVGVEMNPVFRAGLNMLAGVKKRDIRVGRELLVKRWKGC